MRLFHTLLAVVLTTSTLQAQSLQQAKQNVRQAAINMGSVLVSKNFEAFIMFTYPKAIENAKGGAEQMAAGMKMQVENMEKNGNFINAVWPGDPSAMVDTAGELQCTIPQFMKIKLENGVITTTTTLVCLSPDHGNTWYFIDAADQSLERMRTLFPNISSQLVIPPNPEPKFEAFKK